jgi:CRISPR-associated protein Csd1
MILQRLYQLAVRENLLDDLAFEEQPVPFIVQVGHNGEYLGIEIRRGSVIIASKKKDAPPKTQLDKGRVLLVPRPHGNTANQGFARYFVDTLPRVLPVSAEEKSVRSRNTFWDQMARAGSETNDPALCAIESLGRRIQTDAALAACIKADVEALKPGASDRCTFAWHSDQGATIVEREAVRSWFRQFLQSLDTTRQQHGPSGVCQVMGTMGPMPTTHSMRLSGIPGGLPTGVSIVSYDKAAFESYGLEGTANACIGYLGADGYLRALTALISNKLKDNPRTRMKVGEVLFLFWTSKPADTGFMDLIDSPDAAQVEHLFVSVSAGQEDRSLDDSNAFYLLGLSGNSARAIIRDYLEIPLPRIKWNLAKWFRDLRIADLTKDGAGKPTSRFPLWLLAAATALDMDQVSPETPPCLLTAALKGDPVPESLLVACVRRLRAEGSSGFRPARMALIKLILLRRNINVTETLNPEETHAAYLYGRLLAVFEQIQYAALGEVNANVVDKFYGTFSAAPALVFCRLYANAQNHLRKLRGDKPGTHVVLRKLLTDLSSMLPASPPRGHLSLQDQGRFALGYYHQRARQFEAIAEKKAQAAAKEEQAVSNE